MGCWLHFNCFVKMNQSKPAKAWSRMYSNHLRVSDRLASLGSTIVIVTTSPPALLPPTVTAEELHVHKVTEEGQVFQLTSAANTAAFLHWFECSTYLPKMMTPASGEVSVVELFNTSPPFPRQRYIVSDATLLEIIWVEQLNIVFNHSWIQGWDVRLRCQDCKLLAGGHALDHWRFST